MNPTPQPSVFDSVPIEIAVKFSEGGNHRSAKTNRSVCIIQNLRTGTNKMTFWAIAQQYCPIRTIVNDA